MLDSLMKLGIPSGSKKGSNDVDQLQNLLALARAERAALSTLLSQVDLQKPRLSQAGRTLTQLESRVGAANAQLDKLVVRAGHVEEKLTRFDEVDRRLSTLEDVGREAQEHAAASAELVRQLELKLVPLRELKDLAAVAEERVAALNALSEHVTQKTRVLEGQKQTLDQAILQGQRVGEMVLAMEGQIARLNETHRQALEVERVVAHVEEVAAGAASNLDAATAARDHFQRELGRLERVRHDLVELTRATEERFDLERRELATFDERMRLLQDGLAGLEDRLLGLAAKDAEAVAIGQRLDAVAAQFKDLLHEADEIQRRQSEISPLQEQLGRLDELAGQTKRQMEQLQGGKASLDALRQELDACRALYGQVVGHRDRLDSDRRTLGAFVERMADFRLKAPELDTRLEALQIKLSAVETANARVQELGAATDALSQKAEAVERRTEFVDSVLGRVTQLASLASDVDRRIQEQVQRRDQLDAVANACQALALRIDDLQHRLDQLGAAQLALAPLSARVEKLQAEAGAAAAGLAGLQRDEVQLAHQERRLAALADSSKTLTVEIADRLSQVESLNRELARGTAAKDELIAELARTQARQRDVQAQGETAEEHLKRLDSLMAQTEQRRAQLTFAQRKLDTVEAKIGDLKQLEQTLERQLQTTAARFDVVEAMKKEVEGVRDLTARSKADLEFINSRRSDVAGLRSTVDTLLGAISATDERLAAIESRRRLVDEVQLKTNVTASMLEDVRINLEMLTEQKAVIDHVAETAARLDAVRHEAQSALKALQSERELAERIERSIRQLRGRSAAKAEAGEAKKSA